MTLAADPLSLVYDKLWDLLEANEALAALVPVGNRVKWAGWFQNPTKDVLSDADTPQLAILPAGCLFQLNTTSSSTFLTARYDIRLIVGEHMLDQVGGLFPIKWELLKSMRDWSTHIGSLQWNSKKFIRQLLTEEASDEPFDENRGPKGWVTFFRFVVHMHFTTSDL